MEFAFDHGGLKKRGKEHGKEPGKKSAGGKRGEKT